MYKSNEMPKRCANVKLLIINIFVNGSYLH